MSLYYEREGITLYCGDALETLRSLPDGIAQMCVTSPPYWGLRDYGVDGQLGLESTPEEYVTRMVEVFREVRRVLRDDGTLWLNIGDSYATPKVGNTRPAGYDGGRVTLPNRINTDSFSKPLAEGCKPKDLVGIPWMLAFALRADGWYLRSDIIWAKPNPMPESVTDRPTKAHEYLFLLSKRERYWYDAGAIREAAEWARWGDQTVSKEQQGTAKWIANQSKAEIHRRQTDKQRGHSRRHAGFNDRWDGMTKEEQSAMGRNKRTVWTIATEPYPEAHFATFPPALVEPCILAGSPEGGTVLEPFAGSGTTLEVAKKFGRKAIGIELNPAYLPLIEKRLKRITKPMPLFVEDVS